MEQQYNSLESVFKTPPNEFRMMPFWFWNHEMVEKEIVRQIDDHYAHGIGGEFIHPRHGRLTPYMGQRWLETVEAAADKCKELDMPCFLYDEDNWPSGPAGGLITGPYRPENRGKYVAMFDENVFEGGQSVEYSLDYQKISPETTFFAAIAVPNPENYPNFADVIGKQINVTEFVKEGIFKWNVPAGEWAVQFFCVLINAPNSGLNGYIDILRKDTVKDFIDITHRRYAEYFINRGKKDYLGTVVPGIFTDEPSLAHMSAMAGQMMKWFTFTPEMPKRFQEMFGYDFNQILISMGNDTGSIGNKHRCDYWACTIDLYTNAFYKQIYDYCNTVGWRATGHINGEGSFPGHIKQHGDFFAVFKYMHYGGLDQLTEEVRPDHIENLWNYKGNPYTGMALDQILSPKLASSAAHLLNKPRVLVEAFGTSSWDITLASAKLVNDYLIATGCDLFVPHSFNISEDGYRKGDHPAAFNYQPYYAHWKRLADHNARLCAILNAHSGVLIPEILFFYPAKGFHAEMMPNTSPTAETMGIYLTHNADCLYRQQLDFEIASEEMILDGKIEGKTIKIAQESFRVLLLNPTTCVTLPFAQFVKKFFDAGGKIIGSCLLPYKDPHTGESAEIASIFKEIFNISPKEHDQDVMGGKITQSRVSVNRNNAGGQAIFIVSTEKMPFTTDYFLAFEQACNLILPAETRDMCLYKDKSAKSHPAYVMATHKHFTDRDIYFFANTSRSQKYDHVDITLNINPAKVELWDTETGEIVPLDWYGIENGKLHLELCFPLYKSSLIVVYPTSEGHIAADRALKERGCICSKSPILIQDLGKVWQLKLNDPNGAMLYKKWQSEYNVEAGRAWGYRRNLKFKHNFIVENLADISPVKLVIEGIVGDYGWCKSTTDPLVGGDRAHFTFPSCISIQINGTSCPVHFSFDYEYLDAYWIVCDITKLLKEGENEVKMECDTHNHSTFHVITDPWRLIGKFDAEEKNGIPILKKSRQTVELGDYSTQGLARYFGGLSYIQNCEIAKAMDGKKCYLAIPDTTDAIEVKVNDQYVAVNWRKWECEITKYVKFGQSNKIELIYYGIAQNMLQTNIKPQGIRSKVELRFYD